MTDGTDQPAEQSRETWQVDVVEYSYGQIIVREGEPADCAYIVKFGEVEVLKGAGKGREIHIARLGPHEIFGEICLFEENSTRSATVRVRSDRVRVMCISKIYFEKQMEGMPDSIRNIIQVLTNRLRKANDEILRLNIRLSQQAPDTD